MYTKEDLFSQLQSLGVTGSEVVIVHSAYSTVGDFLGGGQGFLDSLIEYFAKGGILCIPTHTWQLLGKSQITLDMTTKYTNLGLLSRLALEHKDGTRSENPTHSVVAFGDKDKVKELICCEKYVITPTAKDGFYSKFLENKGKILLIGVSQSANTYLHFVEEMLGIPNRIEKTPQKLFVKKADGAMIERSIFMFDERGGDPSHRFDKYATAFDYLGVCKRGSICLAPAILCDAEGALMAVEKIYRKLGSDPLSDEAPIHPKLFVF